MNKLDILQRVAFCLVPHGAYLRQDGHSALKDVLIAKVTPGDGSYGLQVVQARMFFEGLEEVTADFGPVPNSAMLRRLHEGCIQMRRGIIASLTLVDLVEQLVQEHRTMVRVIGEVASELRIVYEKPDDPFLQTA